VEYLRANDLADLVDASFSVDFISRVDPFVVPYPYSWRLVRQVGTEVD